MGVGTKPAAGSQGPRSPVTCRAAPSPPPGGDTDGCHPLLCRWTFCLCPRLAPREVTSSVISRRVSMMLIFKNQGLVGRSRATKIVCRGERDSPPERAENQHKTRPVFFAGGGRGHWVGPNPICLASYKDRGFRHADGHPGRAHRGDSGRRQRGWRAPPHEQGDGWAGGRAWHGDRGRTYG